MNSDSGFNSLIAWYVRLDPVLPTWIKESEIRTVKIRRQSIHDLSASDRMTEINLSFISFPPQVDDIRATWRLPQPRASFHPNIYYLSASVSCLCLGRAAPGPHYYRGPLTWWYNYYICIRIIREQWARKPFIRAHTVMSLKLDSPPGLYRLALELNGRFVLPPNYSRAPAYLHLFN